MGRFVIVEKVRAHVMQPCGERWCNLFSANELLDLGGGSSFAAKRTAVSGLDLPGQGSDAITFSLGRSHRLQ